MPAAGLVEPGHGRDGYLAVSPLTAAQIMLSIDRYLGGHFFDTQAGGSAPFGCTSSGSSGSGSLRSDYSGLRLCIRDHSSIFAQTDLWIPVMVAATICIGSSVERLGASHVHDRDEFLRQQLFLCLRQWLSRSYGIKIFNWLAPCGAERSSSRRPMIFCIGFLLQF